MSKKIYFETVFSQAPRILGLLDRNIGSLTYGCFDRSYWHYQIVDFPCARFQEAVLTLGLLYNLKLDRNIYFKNKNILVWINAALRFWCEIQEKDGSFNEWYPRENSFVATAFSAYAVSETLLILEPSSINEYGMILTCLKKAGYWLMSKTETRAVNQTAGAAIALYNISLLSKEEKYLAACRRKIDFLCKNQNEEGWFLEYGGADIGYLSLAVDYLAKYYKKTADKRALEILEKAILFIFNFIHHNYAFGGSYTSRNTEYIIPSGFEIMAKYSDKSNVLSGVIRKSIMDNHTITPVSLDDRYLVYLGYNYLQAFLEASDNAESYRFEFSDSVISYPNLGIEIIKRNNFQLVCNYKKGGTFKIIFSNNKSVEDWGVILESNKAKRYFSGWLNLDSICQKAESLSFTAKTEFQEIKGFVVSPLKFISLRLFQAFFGFYAGIGIWLKNKLRDILVTPKSKASIILKRNFKFRDKSIVISDVIEGAKNVKTVSLGAKVSYIYVPSSHYFQAQDLENQVLVYNHAGSSDVIDLIREYDFEGNLIKTNF